MLIESIGGDRFLWGINELQYLEHSEALAVFSAKAGLVQKVQHGGAATGDNRTVPLSLCMIRGRYFRINRPLVPFAESTIISLSRLLMADF